MGWEVLEEVVHGLPRRNSIIANQRKGYDKNLASVRRVGNRFGVSYHSSLEDLESPPVSNQPRNNLSESFQETSRNGGKSYQFSCYTLLRTKAISLINRAIFQLKTYQALILPIEYLGGDWWVEDLSHDERDDGPARRSLGDDTARYSKGSNSWPSINE